MTVKKRALDACYYDEVERRKRSLNQIHSAAVVAKPLYVSSRSKKALVL